jgi:beta-glucosidase/6-phospho-beta-glucosidase/beta-galactosidase
LYQISCSFIYGIQYEGETNKHGRGPAIWDTFTEKYTGVCVCV